MKLNIQASVQAIEFEHLSQLCCKSFCSVILARRIEDGVFEDSQQVSKRGKGDHTCTIKGIQILVYEGSGFLISDLSISYSLMQGERVLLLVLTSGNFSEWMVYIN